jgi:hypothetical protein
VRLRVVDQLAGYELRDRDGTVVERVPGRAEAPYAVTLVDGPGGVRISSVEPG